MKSFLEEYGFTILAAIVVILIIAMCTPIGNLIKEQVLGVVNSFAAKTEGKLAAIDADAPVKVVLKQDGNGTGKNAEGVNSEADKPGMFKFSVTSASDLDKYKIEYRVKDQNGNWSVWAYAGADSVGAVTAGTHEHIFKFTTPVTDASSNKGPGIQNGNQIQVRVTDTGKADNIYYESNIVTYTGDSAN